MVYAQRNRRMRQLIAILVFCLLPVFASADDLTGDPVAGAQVIKICAACHSIIDTGNKVGPSLIGVFNRKVATAPGFSYSTAMRSFGAGDIVWDEKLLNLYLAQPRSVVPGTSMAFAGIKDDQKRADAIAFLKTLKDGPAPAVPAAPQPAKLLQGYPDEGIIIAVQEKCALCHSLATRTNRVGPYLKGIYGAHIANVPDFPYTDAMRAFALNHPVWDDATLDRFLTDPKGVVPGTHMAQPGVQDPQDRANLIAYLKTLQ